MRKKNELLNKREKNKLTKNKIYKHVWNSRANSTGTPAEITTTTEIHHHHL